MSFMGIVEMFFQSTVVLLGAAIADIRWFREKRAYLFLISFTNRGTFTADTAMSLVVAGVIS